MALDVALSIATGRTWHGHVTRRAPVVYVAGEGVRGLAQRAAAWEQHHGCSGGDFFVVKAAVQLRNSTEVGELLNSVTARNLQPGLVVIDTLARSFVGGDENSATDMGELVDAVQRIQTDLQCAVILVHHTGKKGGAQTQERGSSALRGAMDTMVRVGMSNRVVTISCDKQKDAEPFDKLMLNLQTVTLAATSAGDPSATSCVLQRVGAIKSLPSSLTGKQQDALEALAASAQGRTTNKAWKQALQARGGAIADRTFYDAITELVDRGYATKVGRGSYEITVQGAATANLMQSAANRSANLTAATAHTPVGGVVVQHGLQTPDQEAGNGD